VITLSILFLPVGIVELKEEIEYDLLSFNSINSPPENLLRSSFSLRAISGKTPTFLQARSSLSKGKSSRLFI